MDQNRVTWQHEVAKKAGKSNQLATGKQTKKKVNTYFIPHTKINSEGIIDPNAKENLGVNLHEL